MCNQISVTLALISVFIHHADSWQDSRDDEVARYYSTSSPWGEWGEFRYCDFGDYAIGFSLKVEPNQGGSDVFGQGGDDTTVNDFRLVCKHLDGTGDSESVQGTNGEVWGSWGSSAECDDGEFATGFKVKWEEPQGDGDDTTLNSVQFKCSDDAIIEPTNGGEWGEWSDWTYCPDQSYICGFNQKVEADVGGGDDTALGELEFACCQYIPNFFDREGDYLLIGGSQFGERQTFSYSYGVSSTLTNTITHGYSTTLTKSYNAGISFKGVSLGAERSTAETSSVETSISDSVGTSEVATKTTWCDKTYLFQWIIRGKEELGDSIGDFVIYPSLFLCTWTNDPQCPFGDCLDANCQYCFGEDQNIYHLEEAYTRKLYVPSTGNNEYTSIRSKSNPNLCLDVDVNQINSNGGLVQLWECNGQTQQQWKLTDSYRLQNAGGKCLDIHLDDYEDAIDGGKVQVWDCHDQDNQFWLPLEAGQIIANNWKCLDIDSNTAGQNGAIIQVWSCNGWDNQNFIFDFGDIGDGQALEWKSDAIQEVHEWSLFENEDWYQCPDGYVLAGFWKNDCQGLWCLEKMKCVRPDTDITLTQDCYEEDIGLAFDTKGYAKCDDGYFVRGIYSSSAVVDQELGLYNLETLRCCKYNELTYGDEEVHDWWGCFDNSEDEKWCEVDSDEYITGFYRT